MLLMKLKKTSTHLIKESLLELVIVDNMNGLIKFKWDRLLLVCQLKDLKTLKK